MPSITHVHPGEAVTVYATPDNPKRVSVAGGSVYHEGTDVEGRSHKLSGSVLIEGTHTFVGGSTISVENSDDGVEVKKAPRKPRPSEKAKKAAAKKKAPAKKSKAKK